ncbi:mannan-binding protein [Cystobacter fuscus]|uniref:mannan-binding protein n=1 Tax=Cystobacter fuscus TaxID=43 RepID=UPI002B2C7877|nr:hypothetical protein F0U63_29515 [Cystobacter fuscus]
MKKQIGMMALAMSAMLFFGPQAEADSPNTEAGNHRDDVEAGPIYGDTAAPGKCPQTCSNNSRYWTGHWRTTVKNEMSVCRCATPPFKHLVIDAGSSGTRFLLYNVERGPRGCQVSLSSDLSPNKGPIEEEGLAEMDVNEAEKMLKAKLEELGEPLTRVVLLGTGGFRQKGVLGSEKMQELSGRLAQRIDHMAIISGDTEGMLAWKATKSTMNLPVQPFSILEIGGVSVQFATGSMDSDFTSISDEVGFNVIAKKMKNCLENEDPFTNCEAAISRRLKDSRLLEVGGRFPEGKPRPVYMIGPESAKLFNKKAKLRPADLAKMGKGTCRQEKDRKCLGMAHLSAVMKALKVESIQKGAESWAEGAAVNSEYFPNCK